MEEYKIGEIPQEDFPFVLLAMLGILSWSIYKIKAQEESKEETQEFMSK